jgi:hypothetical protein
MNAGFSSSSGKESDMKGYTTEEAARELHGSVGDGKAVVATVKGNRSVVTVNTWQAAIKTAEPNHYVSAEPATEKNVAGARNANAREQTLIDAVRWEA